MRGVFVGLVLAVTLPVAAADPDLIGYLANNAIYYGAYCEYATPLIPDVPKRDFRAGEGATTYFSIDVNAPSSLMWLLNDPSGTSFHLQINPRWKCPDEMGHADRHCYRVGQAISWCRLDVAPGRYYARVLRDGLYDGGTETPYAITAHLDSPQGSDWPPPN